jgi:uncharacterized protein
LEDLFLDGRNLSHKATYGFDLVWHCDYNGPLMHELPSPPVEAGKTPAGRFLDRLAAFAEILIVVLLGSLLVEGVFGVLGRSPLTDARHLVVFMWLEAGLALVIMTVLLRLRKTSWRELGWTRSGLGKEVRLGLLVLPALFGITLVVGALFEAFLPDYVSPRNPLLDKIRTGSDLALFLISSLFVGGFKEELQRAFVLTRFEHYLGGVWVGLLVWTTVFAALHSYQGVDKAVAAGVLGLIFGLLYIWRRKLPAPIVAHAWYDVVTLILFWTIFRD